MVATFCLGGLAISGVIRSSCTFLVKRARRRAASRGVGVVLLGCGVIVHEASSLCNDRFESTLGSMFHEPDCTSFDSVFCDFRSFVAC